RLTTSGQATIDIFASSPTVADCDFVGSGSIFNGAIRCGDDASPHILRCSTNGVYAGIASFSSDPLVENSRLNGNNVGAILWSGGRPILHNCIVRSGFRGVDVSQTIATLRNCSISANTQGIAANSGAQVSLFNSIVWGNSVSFVKDAPSTISASFSDIQGG